MVGTRHAVSENQEQSGLGMPSPYAPDVIKCENGNCIMGNIEREKQTVEAMIRLYCKGKRHGETENGTAHRSSAHLSVFRFHLSVFPVPPLCPQCQALLDYAIQRLEHCRFGEDKPSCTRCPVHCYKPAMREQIKQVMRYSGPRMLLHDPILAIGHLWDFLRAKVGG